MHKVCRICKHFEPDTNQCARVDPIYVRTKKGEMLDVRPTVAPEWSCDHFVLYQQTFRSSEVDELANELDRWLDKAREIGDRYK